MTPARKPYVNDDPPKLCECGHFLKGQMSVKTGICGSCTRELRLRLGKASINIRRKRGRWDGKEWNEE